MASRNRNRPGVVKEDADEERSLWNQIRSEAKRIDSLVSEHNSKWQRMQEIKHILDSQHSAGEDPSAELEDELMRLSRENIKICDDVIAAVEGASDHDVDSLLGRLNLLTALRASSEADTVSTPMSRVASSNKPSRNAKRGKDTLSIPPADDGDTAMAASPSIPSPKVSIPATRLKVSTGGSRAGSVPAAREASVKIEDATDTDGNKSATSESKSKYNVGTEVLYRKKGQQRGKDAEGDGILCEVTTVIGEGKQRRYEIRDVDPDTESPLPYRASLQEMTPIPGMGIILPPLPPGKNVLAKYPETTTFYKAEVVPLKKDGPTPTPEGYVRLRFEGEEELDREMEVERRYVLLDWTGK